MLRPRIIPCLLISDGGLVKTVRFAEPKYVGDPINTVRIFNEKEVDELIVLDIGASAVGHQPDFDLIRNLAAESRMPLCYGGGVRTVSDATRIIQSGVEKVALGTAAVMAPEIVAKLAADVGRQSVVVVLDVRQRDGCEYGLYVENGEKDVGIDPFAMAETLEALGAGEIVLNSIDNDGMMSGYDFTAASMLRDAVDIPITILGGAGSYSDVEDLIRRFGVVGAAGGSVFVFKGRYRAVLVNYPTWEQKLEMCDSGSRNEQ